MRFAPSLSTDYSPHRVVVRDFKSEPPGRVLLIIARDNQHEAEQVAVTICDLLNEKERNELGSV
jgi:hypothetical protein